jgi:hypothetical protein
MLKEACSLAYPESAICVQRFDDSLNSAIRITYRISLRSSSLREPRYPLLRVVLCFVRISSPFYWSMKTLVQKFKGVVQIVNQSADLWIRFETTGAGRALGKNKRNYKSQERVSCVCNCTLHVVSKARTVHNGLYVDT